MVMGYKFVKNAQPEHEDNGTPVVNWTDERKEVAKPSSLHAKQKHRGRLTKKTLAILSICVCLLLLAGGFAYWKLFVWQPADANPFSAKTMASVQIPLYYPTRLPNGYRIDTKSVSEPQAGVVIFNMIGPNGEKLYMSEEARPVTFNLGGFYAKLDDMKETSVSDGTIAVGRVKNGQEVASRANKKTWILSNTTAQIPFNQLTAMMKSLTLSY
jgi:hypothetical protein